MPIHIVRRIIFKDRFQKVITVIVDAPTNMYILLVIFSRSHA